MTEERKLSEMKSFWAALIIPLVVSLMAAGIIAFNSELRFDPTYIGFNKAVDIFKVPLSILALAFPLVALVATNHRSSQSSEMLKRNSTQQAFSNYYMHREEFFKVLSRLENELGIKFGDANGLYRTLFPRNSVENLELRSLEENSDKSALEFHAKNYEKLMESIRTPSLSLRQVQNFYLEFFLLSSNLGFVVDDGIIINWPIYFGVDKSRGWKVAFEEENTLKHCWITSQVLTRMSDFCHIDRNMHLISFTPYSEFEKLARSAFELASHNNSSQQDASEAVASA